MLSEAVAFHPAPAQISLSGVFDALSDPVRRLIVARLSEYGELNCSSFLDCGSKTAISYHLARLREAGLTTTRKDGKLHYMALREAELEQRFPGMIRPVIASLREEALAQARTAGEAPFQLHESAVQPGSTAKPRPRKAPAKAARRKTAAAQG